MATEIEIAEFEAELDVYDEATVKALLENERRLAEVSEEINALLEQAYVLPDGRHVFKTEDGLRVFDEYGTELAAEVIEPETIPDHHPRWEAFHAVIDEHESLTQEREQILKFQQELDEVRGEIAEGDVTKDQLADYGDRLAAMAPDAVREQHPDLEASHTPSVQSHFQSASADVPEITAPTRTLEQFIPQ